MGRDYTPRRGSRQKEKTSLGSLVKGLLLGIVVATISFLVVSQSNTWWPALKAEMTNQALSVLNTSTDSQKVTTQNKQAQKPKFDFYTILPEMEAAVPTQPVAQPPAANAAPTPPPVVNTTLQPVVTPAQSPATTNTTASAAPNAIKPTAEPRVSYMLQLASFKNYADADQLKAKLSLSGFRVSIQTVDIGNGEQWHRVRTGPYDSLSAAEEHRRQLQEQKINSIVLKLQG